MPAYIGNRLPPLGLFVELAEGDDEEVIVEQRSHKNLAVRALLILADPAQKLDFYSPHPGAMSSDQNVRNQT
jgi:hypothetical protein